MPLEHEYDRPDVYPYSGKSSQISARGFIKMNDLMTEETVRYTPEWDDSLGNDTIDGGFRIDFDQDGEVVTGDASDDASADSDDDNTVNAG